MSVNEWLWAAQVAQSVNTVALIISGGACAIWFAHRDDKGAEHLVRWAPRVAIVALVVFFASMMVPSRETLLYSAGFEHGPEILERIDQRAADWIKEQSK